MLHPFSILPRKNLQRLVTTTQCTSSLLMVQNYSKKINYSFSSYTSTGNRVFPVYLFVIYDCTIICDIKIACLLRDVNHF